MSSIAITGSATGAGGVSLLAPVTNTNRALTLPDADGTLLSTATAGVPINGPAFSAYRATSTQNVSTNTWTKAQLNAEDFDTASAFDSSTNYRFTPQTAGYYIITGSIQPDSSSAFGAGVYVAIYKNGSVYRVGTVNNTSATTASTPNVAVVIYFNGSTDYVELYGYFAGGAGMGFGTTYNATSLSGAMIRSAI